jgi:hypothetical protein
MARHGTADSRTATTSLAQSWPEIQLSCHHVPPPFHFQHEVDREPKANASLYRISLPDVSGHPPWTPVEKKPRDTNPIHAADEPPTLTIAALWFSPYLSPTSHPPSQLWGRPRTRQSLPNSCGGRGTHQMSFLAPNCTADRVHPGLRYWISKRRSGNRDGGSRGKTLGSGEGGSIPLSRRWAGGGSGSAWLCMVGRERARLGWEILEGFQGSALLWL